MRLFGSKEKVSIAKKQISDALLGDYGVNKVAVYYNTEEKRYYVGISTQDSSKIDEIKELIFKHQQKGTIATVSFEVVSEGPILALNKM